MRLGVDMWGLGFHWSPGSPALQPAYIRFAFSIISVVTNIITMLFAVMIATVGLYTQAS